MSKRLCLSTSSGARCWHLALLVFTATLLVQGFTPAQAAIGQLPQTFVWTSESDTPITPVFADFNPATSAEGLEGVVKDVPGLSATGFYLKASNRADDVYYGLKWYLSGLPKKQALKLAFNITIASNAGLECAGAGGSPGSSVWIKAGAAAVEPTVSLQRDTWRFSNINKGEQSTSGPAGNVLGLAGIPGDNCSDSAPFALKTLSGKHYVPKGCKGRCATSGKHVIRTSAKGGLWVLVGAESGYEGVNQLYITRIQVTLDKL